MRGNLPGESMNNSTTFAPQNRLPIGGQLALFLLLPDRSY
ncbi:hypothetical protein AXX16_0086 [Serratia rubidaea]|nr:hypothetical protein AXX16_0086 [Serratia rubidaea]